MAQIFISYSKQNVEFARYLRGALQHAGFDVWMDEARLSTSAQWADTIEASVRDAAIFMIIMSAEAKESKWVARELLLAQRLHKPIFPILYSGQVWWNLADIQYEDMTAGLQSALSERLIASLRRGLAGTLDDESAASSSVTPADSPEPRSDARRLEAAIPAETRAGSDTEVWAKISLPYSEGLRGELPATVPSGDVIGKADARATGFPIRFPIDTRTGKRLPAHAALRIASGDFEIVSPSPYVDVEIPPDADSRTVIFTLEPKLGSRTSGRTRIFIDLIQDEKVIAQISVSTVLVERVTAAVPAWNLAALGYALPADARRSAAPAAAPPPILQDILALEGMGDFAPIDDYLASPAAPPAPVPASSMQPLVDAPRSSEPQTSVYVFERDELSTASRRGVSPLLRVASAVAALGLVFVVALSVMQSGAPASALPTPTALSLISATAASVERRDIAVAPLLNCAGSPGAALVSILGDLSFSAQLLPEGFTSAPPAQALVGFRVVAWGMCSGDTLTLTLELNATNPRDGISDPRSITLTGTPGALGQSGSIPVRVVRAVTQYARGVGDYRALAQTFDELAGAVTDPEASAALRTLSNNSQFYAGQGDVTPDVSR